MNRPIKQLTNQLVNHIISSSHRAFECLPRPVRSCAPIRAVSSVSAPFPVSVAASVFLSQGNVTTLDGVLLPMASPPLRCDVRGKSGGLHQQSQEPSANHVGCAGWTCGSSNPALFRGDFSLDHSFRREVRAVTIQKRRQRMPRQ